MKILAIEKEINKVSGDRHAQILKDEAKKVWELVQEGTIREIYFTKDEHNSVIILECKNKASAESILSTLPLVREKIIEFEIKPLVPYDGYSRLFD